MYYSGGWKAEIRVPAPSSEGPLPGLTPGAASSLGGRGQGARSCAGVPFIRALILFMRAPPPWPAHLPEALPASTVAFAG